MPFKKLKGRMREYQLTQEELAKKLGKSKTFISNRFVGLFPFDMDTVYSICDLLEIPYSAIYLFFPQGGKELKKGE